MMSGIDSQENKEPAQWDQPSPETAETQEKAEAPGKPIDVIARAEATLHDQILAPKDGEDIEDELGLDRCDTRGAWPNWTKKS